jgi:hypothetical protein
LPRPDKLKGQPGALDDCQEARTITGPVSGKARLKIISETQVMFRVMVRGAEMK